MIRKFLEKRLNIAPWYMSTGALLLHYFGLHQYQQATRITVSSGAHVVRMCMRCGKWSRI